MKRSFVVSHSLFGDSTTIFLNGRNISMEAMMHFSNDYQLASGQKVSSSKSTFLVSSKMPVTRVMMISKATGFSRGSLPFKYLGCLIFKGLSKQIYFEELVNNIQAKIATW